MPRALALTACGGLLLGSLLAAILLGPYPLSWSEVFCALGDLLQGKGQGPAALVLHLRLSRLALAFVAGASLAVAGAVLQTVLANPLADPFTLGVSSGAACGATFALIAGAAGTLAVPLSALAGGSLALVLVLGLCLASRSFSHETLILAGILVSTTLAALIALAKALHEDSVASIVFWLLGSFQNRSWPHLFLMLPLTLPALTVVLLASQVLDVLALGGESAHLLGLPVTQTRILLVLAAAALTAAAVSVAGIIGFVGLVVPHGARLLVGPRHGVLMPACALLGGGVLLWADLAARTVLAHGTELPVGVITALAGAPAVAATMLALRRKG